MGTFKYTNGILGPKIKGYNNEKRKYNIEASKEGVCVYSKNGDLILKVDSSKDNQIFIHTLGNYLGIQDENTKSKSSKFTLIKNNKIIKNSSFSGPLEKNGVIIGCENVYFKVLSGLRGNRFYYRIIKDNNKQVTPDWQVIEHEAQRDGLDRFYCENYRELSKDEFLEESDEDYRNNLEEIAVYLSSGHPLFYQSYTDPDLTAPKPSRNLDNQMILGASITPISPIAGTAVMLNASLNKLNKKDDSQDKKTKSNEDENSFGM